MMEVVNKQTTTTTEDGTNTTDTNQQTDLGATKTEQMMEIVIASR